MPAGRLAWLAPRGLRTAALLGNLLYVAGFVVAVVVLAGLGAAPWRAYANVLAVVAVAAATPILSVRALRARPPSPGTSITAIGLNLVCLAYLAVWPSYSPALLELPALLVPLLNVAAIGSDLLPRGAGPRR